jgi:hypothetical protein
MSEFKASPVPV